MEKKREFADQYDLPTTYTITRGDWGSFNIGSSDGGFIFYATNLDDLRCWVNDIIINALALERDAQEARENEARYKTLTDLVNAYKRGEVGAEGCLPNESFIWVDEAGGALIPEKLLKYLDSQPGSVVIEDSAQFQSAPLYFDSEDIPLAALALGALSAVNPGGAYVDNLAKALFESTMALRVEG